MAKETQLIDKDTKEQLFPITGSKAVIRPDASTVEETLAELEGRESGIPDAPSDGKTYGRKNGAWSEVTGGGSSDAVLYTPQELTEEQQGQARANILALGQQDSTVYDIVHLAWTTDATTTRKSIPAGNRKKGVKISYTNGSGVYIVEQYQSEDVSDSAWADNANWKGCRTPLTPLFESLPEVHFNDETGFYEVWLVDDSGLNDVTEEQMMTIYNESSIFGYNYNGQEKYYYGKARAIIPIYNDSDRLNDVNKYNFSANFQTNSNIQYIRFTCSRTQKIVKRIGQTYLK